MPTELTMAIPEDSRHHTLKLEDCRFIIDALEQTGNLPQGRQTHECIDLITEGMTEPSQTTTEIAWGWVSIALVLVGAVMKVRLHVFVEQNRRR